MQANTCVEISGARSRSPARARIFALAISFSQSHFCPEQLTEQSSGRDDHQRDHQHQNRGPHSHGVFSKKLLFAERGRFFHGGERSALDPSIEQRPDDRDRCGRASDGRLKIKLTREWGDLRRSYPAKKKLKSGYGAGTAGDGSPTGSAVGTKTGDRIGQDRRVGGALRPATVGARCDATRRQQTAGKEPHLGDRVTSFLRRPGTGGGELASAGRRVVEVPCPSATRRQGYEWGTEGIGLLLGDYCPRC